MTQAKITTEKEVAFLAKETTFGVLPGTMKPLIIEAGSHEGEQGREQLEDNDSSPLLYDEQLRVDSLFSGSAKCKTKLKPVLSQITSTKPTTPALFEALECIMGGLQVGDGSAISAGTTSSVTVADDTGFAVGQPVGISGSGDVQIAIVENKPGGGVIDIWPNLGSAVTSGTLVNSFAAFATDSNEKSFSYQHAYPDSSSEQQEFRGCIGKFKITSAIAQMLGIELEITAATGQRGALGLSTAVQVNPLAAGGHAMKDVLLYVQTSATTTRTSYCVEDFGVDFDPGLEFTPCITGTEGKDGVQRVKGRGMTKLMFKIKADSAEFTTWTARTARRILMSVPRGSGTTKRHAFVYAPAAVLAAAPKPTKEGGRLLYELEFHVRINTSAAANSIAGSPLIVGAL